MNPVFKQKSKRSILYYVFLSIYVAITLFTLAVSWWFWTDTKQKRFADLTQQLLVIDRYYELTFLQREISLISVGRQLLNTTESDSITLRAKIANDALELNEEFLAFGLADTTGQLIIFTGADSINTTRLPNIADSPVSRRSFLQTKKATGLVIGEAYFYNTLKNWIIPIRVPIKNENNELIAINTSGILYGSLIKDLESFGLDSRYRVHLINETFNTTQIYYPLREDYYDSILRKEASIYTEFEELNEINQVTQFESIDVVQNKKIIGVKSKVIPFDHSLVISVDHKILWFEYWEKLQFILLAFIIAISIIFISNKILIKKEEEYIEDLQNERDYSTGLIKGTPALIVGIAENGTCEFMNPATEIATGYSKEEIIGKNWWDTFYPGSEKQQVEKLLKEFENGEVSDYQMRLTRKDGEKRVISWSSMSLYNDKDKDNRHQVIGFGNDITDLTKTQEALNDYTEKLEELVMERTKELEAKNQALSDGNIELLKQREALQATLDDLKMAQNQLIQAEKMASLGLLSAGIGHEINNPLNFIKGGVGALALHLKKVDKGNTLDTQQFLDVINEGVKRTTDIISSLRHFSRHGATMDEKCEIHMIIDNCLVILNNKTKDRIEIIKEYCPGSLELLGNDGKLHQAFLNILANAEQAIPKEGRIKIKTHELIGDIHIECSDNGMGIEKSILSKIHDPFFTTKKPGLGTGLGLSITQSIIEDHGGTIQVESEVGIGTTFKIVLPKKT